MQSVWKKNHYHHLPGVGEEGGGEGNIKGHDCVRDQSPGLLGPLDPFPECLSYSTTNPTYYLGRSGRSLTSYPTTVWDPSPVLGPRNTFPEGLRSGEGPVEVGSVEIWSGSTQEQNYTSDCHILGQEEDSLPNYICCVRCTYRNNRKISIQCSRRPSNKTDKTSLWQLEICTWKLVLDEGADPKL